jgi:hypothetical protein
MSRSTSAGDRTMTSAGRARASARLFAVTGSG